MPNDHRASPGSPGPDDRLLIRYLTGTLSDADAEPLDERSVADDEFAARLEDVENDLIDQYVRGELPDDIRRDVESHYSATPAGREKIAFARAFARQQSAASSSLLDPSLPPSAPSGPSGGPPALEPRAASPRWLALAAGLALAATAGYFAWQNRLAS